MAYRRNRGDIVRLDADFHCGCPSPMRAVRRLQRRVLVVAQPRHVCLWHWLMP